MTVEFFHQNEIKMAFDVGLFFPRLLAHAPFVSKRPYVVFERI